MQKHFAIFTGIAMVAVALFVAYQSKVGDVRGFLGGPGMTSTTSANSVMSKPQIQSSANVIDYNYMCEQVRTSWIAYCLWKFDAYIKLCLADHKGQPASLEKCIEDATKENDVCKSSAQAREDLCLSNQQVSCVADEDCSFPIPGNPNGLKGKCEGGGIYSTGVCKF